MFCSYFFIFYNAVLDQHNSFTGLKIAEIVFLLLAVVSFAFVLDHVFYCNFIIFGLKSYGQFQG